MRMNESGEDGGPDTSCNDKSSREEDSNVKGIAMPSRDETARPRVIVFDLDGTLWSPEMYELWHGGGSPFRRDGSHVDHVLDRSGTKVSLLGETRSLLRMLKFDPLWRESILAISSTCDEPTWARECLRLFTVDDERNVAFADLFRGYDEIYHDCKSKHMEKILRKAQSSDPSITFDDFIFFDNQTNNIDAVSRKAGVFSVYCPQGMIPGIFEKGVERWRAQRKQKGGSL